MDIIVKRANDALEVNPPPFIAEALSVNGSNWLWACVAIYSLFFIVVLALSFKPKANEKIFHYLISIALLVGAITYFSNASDLGWSLTAQNLVPIFNTDQLTGDIVVEGTMRQVFFTKYINWVVAFPIVNILLGLVANSSWTTIVWHVFLSWVWFVSYLVSAYTPSVYKWGFFVFGTVAYLVMALSTVAEGLIDARRVGTQRDYWILAGYFNFLWILYPVAFGLSEGGNTIGVTPHFIFFGVLDVLMIPFGSVLFLLLSTRWDYNKMNLYFTQYGRVAQGDSLPEKPVVPAAPATQWPAPATV